MDKRPAVEKRIAGDPSQPITVRSIHYGGGSRIEPHLHARAQFLHAASGTMSVRTARCAWIVPPSRALWIPPNTVHEIEMQSDVEMRTVYLDRSLSGGLWSTCVVLDVTPLLRELILRVAGASAPGTDDGEALMRVFVAEIGRLRPCAFDLPLPASDDLMHLCRRTMADLALRRSDREDARHVALSARTVYRRFMKETGISFARWKHQARLLEAIRRLSSGSAVTTVALDLGYESPGAFSTMFRRALGMAPRDFVRDIRTAARS